MKGYDEELLAASGGNLDQYHADIKNLGDRLKQEVERLKNTAAGRKRLAAAGFNVPKAAPAKTSATKTAPSKTPKLSAPGNTTSKGTSTKADATSRMATSGRADGKTDNQGLSRKVVNGATRGKKQ